MLIAQLPALLRIRMFLGIPDPLVRGTDLDPAPDPEPIIKQKL